MAITKISFTNFRLKIRTETQSFDYDDQAIEVLQYLPIDDKYDLVMITLQNSEENGIYNPIKMDMYFNLYLVFMYSNINFTDKQKENLSELYDILESNGIIEQIINLIPESEYNQLLNYLDEIMNKQLENRRSVSGILDNFINNLPKQAEAMQNIMENFNPEQFQEVVNFAKAANGGRDIN